MDDDASHIAGPILADTSERLAFLEYVVALLLADAAWKAQPKPTRAKPPSDRDRATLAEIVAVALDDVPFQCGDLTDDPAQAKAYGEALARLLPRSPVDGTEIERLHEIGHRAAWRVRYVGGPEGT